MSNTSPEKIASVLEDVADYVGLLENQVEQYKEAQLQEVEKRTEEEAEKLASRLYEATGEEVDLKVAKKIASSDDEDVKELINKLASREEVDSLGNAKRRPGSTNTKVASADDADAEFASWLLNG